MKFFNIYRWKLSANFDKYTRQIFWAIEKGGHITSDKRIQKRKYENIIKH